MKEHSSMKNISWMAMPIFGSLGVHHIVRAVTYIAVYKVPTGPWYNMRIDSNEFELKVLP